MIAQTRLLAPRRDRRDAGRGVTGRSSALFGIDDPLDPPGHAAAPPPAWIDDPVATEPAGLTLKLPAGPLKLTSAAQQVQGFNPGWRATALCTLLHPYWILLLRHESGEAAAWFVDHRGQLSGAPAQHGPDEHRRWAEVLAPVGLWLRFAPGAAIRVRVPDEVRAWLCLPRDIRDRFTSLPGDAWPPEVSPDRVAPLLEEPVPDLLVRAVPGMRRYLIGNPGLLVTVRNGDAEAELNEGWTLASLQACASPLLLAMLRHRSGEAAAWVLDLDGRLVSNAVERLQEPWLGHMSRLAAPLLRATWQALVLDRENVAPPPPDGFDRLPPQDLEALAVRLLSGPDRDTNPSPAGMADSRRWSLDRPPPPGLAYVVPSARGLVALETGPMRRMVHHPLHQEMDRLVREGRMTWPSPVAGAPAVQSDGFAFLLGLGCFAYRFHDDESGVVFFVVCAGTHFYNHAIYFPEADLLVTSNAEQASHCDAFFTRGRPALLRHAFTHAAALRAGIARPRDPEVQQYFGACAVHIGHYVWQDLAGLAGLLRQAGPGGRLPHLNVFLGDNGQALFGPEERIFPAFEGRVSRYEIRFHEHVAEFYARNQRVIRYTAITVPASVGRAVIEAGRNTPELAADNLAADAARERGPVLLFGIRVGNRTLADLDEFYADLLRRLGRALPGATIVLDGLNSHLDEGRAVPHPAPDLAAEFALADRLRTVATEAGLRFHDNINRSALCSVVWGARADLFVAPWGAALCKYRWICNIPGLALSSRFNLEHRADLRIYDVPAALENASEMVFNAPDEAHDLTVKAVTIGLDGRGDFVVDRDSAWARLEGLIGRHWPRRTTPRQV